MRPGKFHVRFEPRFPQGRPSPLPWVVYSVHPCRRHGAPTVGRVARWRRFATLGEALGWCRQGWPGELELRRLRKAGRELEQGLSR